MKASVGRLWVLAALLGAAVVSMTLPCAAQDTARTRDAAAARQLDKPYTQVEPGIGIFTLPAKDICLTAPQTCTRGDISPELHVWMMYRSAQLAIGAGPTYMPASGSDTPQRTFTDLDRSHTRDYILLDVMGRYYALRLDWLEGWAGATVGGVVINDRYKTKTEDPRAPILGPKGIFIRTEGVSAGIAAGLGWTFAPNWSLEANFRSAWWFLPSERACAPTGDCATLSGDVAMFTLGVGLGYRIAL